MRWRRRKTSAGPAPETPAAPIPPAPVPPPPLAASSPPLRPPAAPVGRARAFPRGAAIFVGLAAATIVGFGLYSIRSIAAPVMLALVLVICVQPLRTVLERWGVSRGLATGSVTFAVFLLLAAFMTALVIAFAQFATLLAEYSTELGQIGATLGSVLAGLGIGADQIEAIMDGFDPGTIVEFVTALLGNVAGLTVGLVFVFTLVLLMAMDAGYLPTLLRQIEPTRPRLVGSIRIYGTGVRRYMIATTVLGLVQGLLNATALVILGVPGAFIWGLLSFLCSFIPNVGYLIAIVPPVLFGYLVGGWETAISVIVVYTLINAIVQGAVQTRVVSNVVALSQTLTFVSVLLWAAIIGPIGALLATPLTLLVRMILIDSDADAGWWRPLTGDVKEARAVMKLETAQNKALRRARKVADRPTAQTRAAAD